MENRVRHVLGISGGKDSAALAIYLKQRYPNLDIEYYTCDTGKELKETYDLIRSLEVFLGKKIIRLKATEDEERNPFDHFYDLYGGFLPSSNARWCTKKLKLEPFENFVGDDPVISYVGIRGDEDREGYISKKSNIQSIFPFRKNIWSEDVVFKALKNDQISSIDECYSFFLGKEYPSRLKEIVNRPLSPNFNLQQKLNQLLDFDTKAFNQYIFEFLKTTSYPLAKERSFDLLENDDVLVRDDIFQLLHDSGVGIPEYYEKIQFEVDGKIGEYARSRSGCYFCFFQQKIEWVWLLEQHPDLFEKAMQYENSKEGFTWTQHESLEEISRPERIEKIKKEYMAKYKAKPTSSLLLDVLEDAEGEGCVSCFI